MVLSLNLSSASIRRIILLLTVAFVAACSSPEEKAKNYYERGIKLLSAQDYVKAGIEFKNALQMKKDLIEAWRGLLQVELHNRNLQAAIPILHTVVELDPKDVGSRIQLGQFVLANNRLDEALNLATAASAIGGRHPK